MKAVTRMRKPLASTTVRDISIFSPEDWLALSERFFGDAELSRPPVAGPRNLRPAATDVPTTRHRKTWHRR